MEKEQRKINRDKYNSIIGNNSIIRHELPKPKTQIDWGESQIKTAGQLTPGTRFQQAHFQQIIDTIFTVQEVQHDADGRICVIAQYIGKHGQSVRKISLADVDIVPYPQGVYNFANWLKMVE